MDWFEDLTSVENNDEVVEKTKPKKKVRAKKAVVEESVVETPKSEKQKVDQPSFSFGDFSRQRLREMVHGKLESHSANLYVHDYILSVIRDIKCRGFDPSKFNNLSGGRIEIFVRIDKSMLHFEIIDDRISPTVRKKIYEASKEFVEYVNSVWVEDEVVVRPKKIRISILEVGNKNGKVNAKK